MKKRPVCIYFLVTLLGLLLPEVAAAATITIQVIATFDYPGATQTYPFAINDQNEIAGFFYVSGALAGFTRTADGQFSDPIVAPNDTHDTTEAFGINNSGTVCGYFFGVDGFHGFLFSDGAYSQYDVPDSSGTVVRGINDAGDLAGYYFARGDAQKGFTSVGGILTTIDFPGGAGVIANQLNSANQVAGSYADKNSGVGYGFYSTRRGTLKFPIMVPGATDTYLHGINDDGWMVGEYYTQPGRIRLGHGLLFIPPNQFVTFEYADSRTIALTGINDKRFICGYYFEGGGIHGLLAKARGTAEEVTDR
jgi:hypothetical protein